MTDIPQDALMILRTLHGSDHQAYLVGGCVRDRLLGREPKDWDIATSATPAEVKAIFDHVIPTGEKHGTVTVMVGEVGYEVTTFRTDGKYTDGRRPDDVTFVMDIKEDLARRDLTINAIAFDGVNYIDPFDGMKDIQHGQIRAVGLAAERFEEDPLRMMRAIRLSTQLGFGISGKTIMAIQDCAPLINRVSQERIRDELTKILLSDDPSMGIGTLYMVGLLDHIMPELARCAGFQQHNPHHRKDVFDHILDVLEGTPAGLNVRLGALFHDIGKPDTLTFDDKGVGHFYRHHVVGADIAETVMTRLRFPSNVVKDVKILVHEHMSRVPGLRSSVVKRFVNRVGEHNLTDLFALMRADIAAHKPPHDYSEVEYLEAEVERIRRERPPMSLKDLAINGSDLIDLGLEAGPTIGRALKTLLEVVIETPAKNTKDALSGILEELNFFD